jgi:hypothetical protein
MKLAKEISRGEENTFSRVLICELLQKENNESILQLSSPEHGLKMKLFSKTTKQRRRKKSLQLIKNNYVNLFKTFRVYRELFSFPQLTELDTATSWRNSLRGRKCKRRLVSRAAATSFSFSFNLQNE